MFPSEPEAQGGQRRVHRVWLQCSRGFPPSAWGRTSLVRTNRSCRQVLLGVAGPPWKTMARLVSRSKVKGPPCKRTHWIEAQQKWGSPQYRGRGEFGREAQPDQPRAWAEFSNIRMFPWDLLTCLWHGPSPPPSAINLFWISLSGNVIKTNWVVYNDQCVCLGDRQS